MKTNENTKIVGKRVILIPYEAKHVQKYHEWMKSPELQKLTASEPLTLEDEYAMQKSWRNDEDKCTFLVLSRETFDNCNEEIQSLIGDTNIFLRTDDNGQKIAEAEIMIAESKFRGRRLGWEAVLLLLKYSHKELNVDKFEVKIGIENIKSIKMFSKMQFNEISRSKVFREVTMERPITPEWISWLDEHVNFDIQEYCSNAENDVLLAKHI